jgi:uncharacterized protein YndB with AHSA1/START domain
MPADAEALLDRTYPQTPAQAFGAFADPELKRRWFANPGGSPDEWSLDFRVGGAERHAGREHGTGKLLDALERFLAAEPVR